MKKCLTILVADDDSRHREMLATLLGEWGYDIVEARDGSEAVDKCSPHAGIEPDLALLDVRMPVKDGIEALHEIKAVNKSMPVIMMTAYSDVPAAVDAIRSGAFDYLTKPLDFPKLKITIRNALAQLGLARENATLAASLAAHEKQPALLGNGPAMAAVENMIRTIAPTEATVLVNGESGTGKELAARLIHKLSGRANGPFVAVNCGALTESLLASELFGHEKGAFTGADRKHKGLFMEAAGGSIFLDEIGEMPIGMQVKLLRVLQEKEVLSVGGKTPQPIDCRVMAATNKDLEKEVAKGRFREDLYYRLNVVNLKMPPLRDRTEDIPLLAQNFANRFAASNNKKLAGISLEAMGCLVNYKWPGNVRELENVMERAVILMPGDYIGPRELPERVAMEYAGNGLDMAYATAEKSAPEEDGAWVEPQQSEEVAPDPLEFAQGLTLEEVERNVIMRTLKQTGNNKTEAAKILGITRKTLHAKLNRYKLEN